MIRANLHTNVKAHAICLLMLFFAASTASKADDFVKPIEVEEFQVKAIKTSKSGKVVMLEDLSKNRPATGKVLLLKSEQSEIMAVRVLKNYNGKFAARVILKFKEFSEGTEFRALKKIGERVRTLVADRDKRNEKEIIQAAEDRALLKEIAPDDNELDKGITSPVTVAKGSKNKDTEKKEAESPVAEKLDDIDRVDTAGGKKKGVSVAPLFDKDGRELSQGDVEVAEDSEESYYDPYSYEIQPLENYKNAISFQYASMNNFDSNNNRATYNAIGLRYSRYFTRMALFDRKSVQDTIGFELSAFTYSISNYRSPTDNVSLLPVEATLKYSLLLGEYFTIFAYGGVLKNFITSSSDVTDLGQLGNTSMAAGGGVQLRIGPAWAVRVDYGIEMFAAGITLKF